MQLWRWSVVYRCFSCNITGFNSNLKLLEICLKENDNEAAIVKDFPTSSTRSQYLFLIVGESMNKIYSCMTGLGSFPGSWTSQSTQNRPWCNFNAVVKKENKPIIHRHVLPLSPPFLILGGLVDSRKQSATSNWMQVFQGKRPLFSLVGMFLVRFGEGGGSGWRVYGVWCLDSLVSDGCCGWCLLSAVVGRDV